jgi:hypothetical protein
VRRNVCHPIEPNFPAEARRSLWMGNRAPFGVGRSCRHQTPEPTPHFGHSTRHHPPPCRPKMPLLNLGRLARSIRQRACEDPAFFRRQGLLAPFEQNLHKRLVKRYVVPMKVALRFLVLSACVS